MARNALARLLIEGRERQGLKQRELAERSGVSRDEIGRIESGKIGLPGPEILKALSRVTGVPVADFVRAAGYPIETAAEAETMRQDSVVKHLRTILDRFEGHSPHIQGGATDQ